MYDEESGYTVQEIDDFKNMNISEQLAYLKNEVSSVKSGTVSAGKKAAYMRTQLKKSMNLEGLFNSKDGDEKFMNENLRDFLNTKEDGSDYTTDDMNGNGWKRLIWPADCEHQNEQTSGRNSKYVNKDGREAVFDAKGNFIRNTIDKGTFNYGKPNWYPASVHGRYDMKPFFRQNKIQPWYWRLRVGSNYSWNSK